MTRIVFVSSVKKTLTRLSIVFTVKTLHRFTFHLPRTNPILLNYTGKMTGFDAIIPVV